MSRRTAGRRGGGGVPRGRASTNRGHFSPRTEDVRGGGVLATRPRGSVLFKGRHRVGNLFGFPTLILSGNARNHPTINKGREPKELWIMTLRLGLLQGLHQALHRDSAGDTLFHDLFRDHGIEDRCTISRIQNSGRGSGDPQGGALNAWPRSPSEAIEKFLERIRPPSRGRVPQPRSHCCAWLRVKHYLHQARKLGHL
ncbi:hypothetical protein Cgig2_011322 [Carnegiea gigantea]|uniref:Uncharacterized protein n=1 Tax=Carnegiea gigantea TaxID=171969 RepID=A0A9Q1KF81_9CARY|nr:hypothetical protein Cgig2_011322 [Carnegiea gigantea]